ncbi:CPBP family intramembrane glutamic endopeptidase [Cyclobacterium sp.]|uniref:CPBP family intramembrane glutamic endopeptidase n=1 Tax=Cyclobacterium sp. TaxID=1966343 RepID=UPI0019AA50A4|nr:CPBP family intramembrane glutamic endopeptidase [Cyclobacterium sp.]MBD3629404.1 CPBP family intramembrane metalloprotease [Cyclobacterium sp.]
MNRKMWLLGWITLLGFGLAGMVLVYFFQEQSMAELWTGHWYLPAQFLLGGLTGFIGAHLSKWLILQPFFETEKIRYRKLINHWSWSGKGIVFISICAGVGEEMFFRAGLQPLLGLWPTAVVFVLIHGYLNPFNWRISTYGLLMVGLIAFFGFLYEEAGIITAMTAHAVFDAVLLFWMTKGNNSIEKVWENFNSNT